MKQISQTYSHPTDVNDIKSYIMDRDLENVLSVTETSKGYYIFDYSEDYFGNNLLHDILDDLCDYLVEIERIRVIARDSSKTLLERWNAIM